MYVFLAIVIAVVAIIVAQHFHLIATIKQLFPKHASSPVPSGSGVTVTVNAGNGSAPANGATANTIPTASGSTTSSPPASSPASAGLPPGVSLVDKVNGLVAFDPSINPALAGQSFCVFPALALFDKGSQAAATIIFNTANAKGAEVNGLGLWIRVSKVVANVGGAAFAPFKMPVPPEWIDNAWTFGSELNTWDAVLTAAKHWHAPVELPGK